MSRPDALESEETTVLNKAINPQCIALGSGPRGIFGKPASNECESPELLIKEYDEQQTTRGDAGTDRAAAPALDRTRL